MADVTLEEVRRFLDENAGRYEELVRRLVEAFERLRVEKRNQLIYAIYSRRHKQGGREFKDDWKIVLAVNKKRQGGKEPEPDPATGEPALDAAGLPKLVEVPAKPYFNIQELDDLVGITVVCVYPSDITRVCDFVTEQGTRGTWVIGKNKRLRQRGYYAHHYMIGINEARYLSLWCDVQIKTLLHDGWGVKTHDLTYKPQGALDTRMRAQIEILGDALAAIDRQSDQVRELIEEVWQADAQRKDAARAVLLAESQGPWVAFADRARYEEVHRYIAGHVDHLKVGEDWREVARQIEELAEDGRHTEATCQLYTMLAAIRLTDDLDDLALDRISRCLQVAADATSRATAYLLKGLALFCFGRLGEAVDATMDALREAEATGQADLIRTIKLNATYYLCELADSDLAKKWNAKARALQLMEEVIAAAGGVDRLTPDELDTVGVSKITLGETEQEVEEGLETCRKALGANDRLPDSAKAFFKIHERMAWRRLLRFT